MKRIVSLAIGIVLLSALTASADMLAYQMKRTSDGAILGNISGSSSVVGGLTKYVFKVTSWTGVDTFKGMDGTFSVGSGKIAVATAYYNGDGEVSDSWAATTLSGHAGVANEPNTSYIGFNAAITGTMDAETGICSEGGGVVFSRTGTFDAGTLAWTDTMSDDLRGTWYSTANKVIGSTFATIYTTGAAPTYSGKVAIGYQGTTFTGDGNIVTIVPVPEPSTIALLGCGLFGLLAYAWRKRK